MTARKSPPATKHDLKLLGDQLTKRLDSRIDQRVAASESRLIEHFDRKLAETIAESESRILRHFDLTIETIRHDLLGANADQIATLEDRVTRIETHVGLTPA